MEKRKHIEVQKFENRSSGYLLLYFEDGGYEVIHSSSSLLPSHLKYETIDEKSTITLRQGYRAKVIMKSESEKDMHVFQRRLAKKLDEEKVSLDNSFRFLDESVGEATSDASFGNSSDDETVILENHSEPDASNATENEPTNLVLCELKNISAIMRKNQCFFEKIYQEMKRIKKRLDARTTAETNEKISPVLFNNTDVARLGHNNMDPSQFAVCLARHLFSDEEIERNMLFPKRSSSRPPLSPNRSNILKNAVMSRFREDCTEEAYRAVNCLGNDLKKGRRKRKRDE